MDRYEWCGVEPESEVKTNVKAIQNVLQRSCWKDRDVFALSEISYVRLRSIRTK